MTPRPIGWFLLFTFISHIVSSVQVQFIMFDPRLRSGLFVYFDGNTVASVWSINSLIALHMFEVSSSLVTRM